MTWVPRLGALEALHRVNEPLEPAQPFGLVQRYGSITMMPSQRHDNAISEKYGQCAVVQQRVSGLLATTAVVFHSFRQTGSRRLRCRRSATLLLFGVAGAPASSARLREGCHQIVNRTCRRLLGDHRLGF